MAVEKIHKLVENGLQESELQQAKIELQKIQEHTPDFVPEALTILKEAILHSEAAKTQRDRLIAEFEKPQYLSHWYEQLTEDIEKHEWISRLMEQFEYYMNTKLKTAPAEFSSSEKDSIKIVMWWEFQKLFTTDTVLGKFIEDTWAKISDAVQWWLAILYKKDWSQKPISEIASEAETMLEDFSKISGENESVLWYLDSHIWENFQSILDYKKNTQKKELNTSTIHEVISGKNMSSQQVYDTIKSSTLELGKSLGNHKDLWEKLTKQIDQLPFGLSDGIRDMISGIVERFPLLGWIVSIIMGKDYLGEFLSGTQKKRKESLNNFAILEEQNNSPINGFFETSWLEGLDAKKLDGFFDYLEAQKIDHSDENFWQELITGKTKDQKIQEIHIALKWDNSTAIEKSDFKNNGAWFLKKLNGVEAYIHEKVTIQEQKQLETSAANLPPVSVSIPATISEVPVKTETNIPKKVAPEKKSDFSLRDVHGEKEAPKVIQAQETPAKQEETKENTEALKEQYTEFRNSVITLALKKSTELPVSIDYQRKEIELQTLWIRAPKTLNFKEGKLVIGNKEYVIDFDTFTHKYLGYVATSVSDLRIKKILEISPSNITLSVVSDEHQKSQEQKIEKSQFIEIILWVLEGKTYSSKISASGNNSEIGFQVLKA